MAASPQTARGGSSRDRAFRRPAAGAAAPRCPAPDTAAPAAAGPAPHRRGKADKVPLLHGVAEGHIPVRLHLLHSHGVLRIRGDSPQRLQLPAAAGELPAGAGRQNVAAVRAHIELQSFHISSIRRSGVQASVQKPLHADAKDLCQVRQQPHIRDALIPLPFAHRLGADAQLLRHLALGPAPLLPQLSEQCPVLWSCIVPHLPLRIPEAGGKRKQRSVEFPAPAAKCPFPPAAAG